MPTYEYIAIGANTRKLKGSLNAESAYAARKQLRLRGLHASQIQEVNTRTARQRSVLSVLHRVRKAEIIDFTKQFAILLNSGIKLTESLSVLCQQTASDTFRNALTEIRDRVVTGESLADVMREYPQFFDVVYVSMVKVGEMTGNLGASLSTIGQFMERRQHVESKIVTAMIYPIVLIVFSLVAVLVLTTQVIPKIGEQIERTGQQLPLITQVLMTVSDVLTSGWLLVVLAVLTVAVFLMGRFFRTDRGAFLRDKCLLNVPIFGGLMKQRVVSRFTSTLSTLLASGLAMAESLRVVGEVTGNMLMKRAVLRARERILAGADIASPLRDSGVISPAVAHMVSVGERSGELDTMLRHISEELDAQTDVVVERLSAAIEPVVIVFMAAVVGVIALGTILPLLQLSDIQM